ncbi:hypothetical protein M6B38_419635 [Iris pallida]|uniref:Uncharacterized protein n=1 Tax=Iris pallida TaxID=29817 RepID=A0AAX6FHF8_IRIPA|nr:hypothetical protein M6B38_419635 [Iris pallida]
MAGLGEFEEIKFKLVNRFSIDELVCIHILLIILLYNCSIIFHCLIWFILCWVSFGSTMVCCSCICFLLSELQM